MNNKLANGMKMWKEKGNLPHYYFSPKNLKFYVKKVNTIVMENFKKFSSTSLGLLTSSILRGHP